MRAYFLILSALLASCDAREFWRDRAPATEEEAPGQGCKKATDCPADKPLCQVAQGRCVACTEIAAATRDVECGTRGARVCVAATGRCGDCNSTSDCQGLGETFTCQAGVCSDVCKRHDDCRSLVCDSFSAGKCLPQSAVIYVDNKGGVGCMSGDGTAPDKALCSLGEIRAKLTATRRAVRLMPSGAPYSVEPLDNLKMVSFFGPAVTPGAGPTAKISGGNPNADSLVVRMDSDLVFDGLEIADGKRGLVCSGNSKVALRRSLVQNSAEQGIFVESCDVQIERCVLSRNRGAIRFRNVARYRLVNNFIADNSAEPAVVTENASGLFSFNTVVRNVSNLGVGGMDCGATPQTIRNSIFVWNKRFPADPLLGSQFSGNCTLENTVVDPEDKIPDAGSTNIIRKVPEFISSPTDLRLKLAAANRDCCIDKIPMRGDVDADIDGTRRPQGAAADIGAHEVVQ